MEAAGHDDDGALAAQGLRDAVAHVLLTRERAVGRHLRGRDGPAHGLAIGPDRGEERTPVAAAEPRLEQMVPQLVLVAAAGPPAQGARVGVRVEGALVRERQGHRVRSALDLSQAEADPGGKVDETQPGLKPPPLHERDVLGSVRRERIVADAPRLILVASRLEGDDGNRRPRAAIPEKRDQRFEVDGRLDQHLARPHLGEQGPEVPGARWAVMADGREVEATFPIEQIEVVAHQRITMAAAIRAKAASPSSVFDQKALPTSSKGQASATLATAASDISGTVGRSRSDFS